MDIIKENNSERKNNILKIDNQRVKIDLFEDQFLSEVTAIPTYKISHLEILKSEKLNLAEIIKKKMIDSGIESPIKIDLSLKNTKIQFQKFLLKQNFYSTAQNISVGISNEDIKEFEVTNNPNIVKVYPNELEPKILKTIATKGSSIYTTSRFFIDKFYTTKLAEQIFYQWIYNTFTGYTDHIYLLTKSGKITSEDIYGFGSIKIKDNGEVWDLDLIGKLDQSQKGVGTRLMSQIYYNIINNNVNQYQTETQATNIGALKLYTKFGMKIKSTSVMLSLIV